MPMVTLPEHADGGPPVRRRWGRYVLLLLLVLVLALAGSYFNWSRRADRGLNALLDELRRNGQPVEAADLNRPPVDPEDDAAIELMTAARLIDTKSATWEQYRRGEMSRPLGPEERAMVAELVRANKPALAKVRAARGKRDADWKIRFQAPLISTLLPHLNEQRNVAELCRLAALEARLNGDDAAAVEHLRDIQVVGNAIDRQPFYVGHLVAVGIHAMGAHELGEFAPALKIKTGADAPGAATPQQVRLAIAELLDDRALEQGIRQGICGERVSLLDTARLIADRKIDINAVAGAGKPPGGMGAPPLPRPMVLTDARIMAQYITDVYNAYDGASDYQAYVKAAPGMPAEVTQNPKLHILAALLLPASDRFIQQQFRILTERRLAATALALRLYAADHGGNYPRALDELVPKYLPAVPADPFAAGGKPLSYSTAADPAAPLVYSVGENGTDAGGSTKPNNPRRADPGRWETDDAVLQMRATPLLKEESKEIEVTEEGKKEEG